MTIRRSLHALLALFRRRHLDQDLESEILAHLELAEQDALARGVSPEEARWAARRSFGRIAQMKEEHRGRRSLRWIETLLRDLRYGLASLLPSPGFTCVIIGVLALGIGANVAMFSVVDAVLLKPLPFPGPNLIVSVWEAPKPGVVNATSAPDFLDWKRLATVFQALSAELPISAALASQDEPLRLSGKAVTADYFQVFGTTARLGRTFTPEEDRPGASPVVVLSHAAWQNRFAADPNILHRRLILDGVSHQVIGVLPAGVFDRDETQFWKPLIFTPNQQLRQIHWLTVYGRLRAGITLSQARDRMQAIHAALTAAAPIEDREATIEVEPLAHLLVGAGLARSLAVAFGAVGLVLLIACANVANLLLARGATRTRELAVRAALGASRSRLVAQLLTESLALCLVGGVTGLAVAWSLIRIATPMFAESLPFTADVSLNLRVLAFAALAALAVGLLSGTLPALKISFGNLVESLNRSTRAVSGAHTRVRRAIVIGEVALSLVLVCGALLLFRSLLKLQQLDTGIRVENVTTMSVDLPVGAYPAPPQATLFYQALAQRLKATPGIAQVGITNYLPLQWISNGEAIQLAGVEKLVRVRLKRIDPGYFPTFGIPLLAGRGIATQDREGTPLVIVINQALAARLMQLTGRKNPIGMRVHVSYPGYVEKREFLPELEVVGVIRSERVSAPGDPDPPVVYAPLAQLPDPRIKLFVLARNATTNVMPAVHAALHSIDPSLPLGDVATMEHVRRATLSGASRPAGLIGAFAAVAVLLTIIGLYGVLSQAVTQQRREIGIRMALGARSFDVLSHVLCNALHMVLVGLVLGLLGAFALTRIISSMLFQTSPLDPFTLTVTCLLMLFIGLLAGFIPANRAARVDPVATLRDEG